MAKLQTELLLLEEGGAEKKSNEWEKVFDQTTISATNGLRLPYNDKASKKPPPEEQARIDRGEVSKAKAFTRLVLEGRPSKAVGALGSKGLFGRGN